MKRKPHQESSGIGWKHLAVVLLVGGVTASPLVFRALNSPAPEETVVATSKIAPPIDSSSVTDLPRASLTEKVTLASERMPAEEPDQLIVLAPMPRPDFPKVTTALQQNFARPAPPEIELAPPAIIPEAEQVVVTKPITDIEVSIPPQETAAEDTVNSTDGDLSLPVEPTSPKPELSPEPASPDTAPSEAPKGPARGSVTDIPDVAGKGELLPQDPVPAVEPVPVGWPEPKSLIKQMDDLANASPECLAWATAVKASFAQLSGSSDLTAESHGPILVELEDLAAEAKTMAKTLSDEESRARLLRAGYAVTRRATLWRQVHVMANQPNVLSGQVPNREELAMRMVEVDAVLSGTPSSEPWRKYLRTERLKAEIVAVSGDVTHEQRELARLVLHKMHSSQLSRDQQNFLKAGPLMALEVTLAPFAEEPLSYPHLLQAIEAFEEVGLAGQSKKVSSFYEQLRWSANSESCRLADLIDNFYRNANVRLALSSQLVNRLIPPQQTTAEAVNDIIQNAHVLGDSQTSTRLKLILLPDAGAWRMGLEATGHVASATSSSSGPATFWQDGLSYYRARKLLVVDRQGFHLFNAEAQANSNAELTAFETDFDGIPLFGSVVRSIARNQYDQKSPLAKAEVEGKIVGRAQNQLNQEVAQRLEKARQELQTKLLNPLQQLDLDPTAIALETTAERVIGRYRLAGYDQISAHTPRPQAPGDSLLSLQLHETALNNSIDHLNLGGRRVELMELYREMNTRFQVDNKTVEEPEDIPEDVYVTFQEEDPIRIDCIDGRVRITIRLKELSQGTKNKWKNFTVKGYYRPDANQLDANLVRDGIIELSGQKLRIGDRTVLSGIFARVMSRNRKLNLVNKRLAESPQLKDQMVTQFVIYDGWLGIALGPKLNQRQTIPLQQPQTAGKAKEVK